MEELGFQPRLDDSEAFSKSSLFRPSDAEPSCRTVNTASVLRDDRRGFSAKDLVDSPVHPNLERPGGRLHKRTVACPLLDQERVTTPTLPCSLRGNPPPRCRSQFLHRF